MPTWRLAVAAAVLTVLGALAPLGAPWGVVAAYAAVLVAAGADWAGAVAPRRIGVHRSLPASVGLGEPARVSWELHNPTARPVRVALADDLAPSLHAGSRRVRVVVPPGGRVRASTEVRPSRRGDFVPTEMVVRTEGRLGLMARQAARSEPGRVRVLPAWPSRQEAELRIEAARVLDVGLRSAQARGGGTEFEQLRDYAVDDEFRRIDWSATARSGRPIVRTYRAERNQQVVVLLDNGRTMAGRVSGVPRVEHAMDAAMMLTAVATRLGDRAGLVAFDCRVRVVVPPAAGAGQFARVVDAIYRLEPELAESDFRAAFTETLVRFRRRALLVVLTELAEQAVEEGLFRDLPLVARTHLVVVARSATRRWGEWARSVPTDAGSSYRKAAAVAALANRRQLVATLQAMGVTVVDAAPGELAPRLADAYLQVKATGRL